MYILKDDDNNVVGISKRAAPKNEDGTDENGWELSTDNQGDLAKFEQFIEGN